MVPFILHINVLLYQTFHNIEAWFHNSHKYSHPSILSHIILRLLQRTAMYIPSLYAQQHFHITNKTHRDERRGGLSPRLQGNFIQLDFSLNSLSLTNFITYESCPSSQSFDSIPPHSHFITQFIHAITIQFHTNPHHIMTKFNTPCAKSNKCTQGWSSPHLVAQVELRSPTDQRMSAPKVPDVVLSEKKSERIKGGSCKNLQWRTFGE